MIHQSQIKKLMNKGEHDKQIVGTIFQLMYYLHQSYSDILQMTPALANELLNQLEKTKKEEAKAYKK